MRYESRGTITDRVHGEIMSTLERLDAVDREAVVMRLLSSTGATTPGECRLHSSKDYPGVRPVLQKDGLHWCCLGDPEHCSTALVPLG
jgi:hypothetical protein